MNIVSRLWSDVKALARRGWLALLGGRACYHCGRFSAEPLVEWDRAFCSRACAGRWRGLFLQANRDQAAREGGAA
jgi:hypothetical protein